MTSKKKLILFDIDHTLFDTHSYLQNSFTKLGEILHVENLDEFISKANIQYRIHRDSGFFRPGQFIQELLTSLSLRGDVEELETVFFNEEVMNASLYPDVEGTLKILTDRGYRIGIFSFGNTSSQRKKIHSLLELLADEYIYITEVDKIESVSEIVEKHTEEELYIVDDIPSILQTFKNKNTQIVTFLIDRENTLPTYQLTENERIDYTIANLSEMLTIIQ